MARHGLRVAKGDGVLFPFTMSTGLMSPDLTLEHSVNYVPSLFHVMGRDTMVRAVAEEALALTSITLFLAMVAVWAQVLSVV